MQIYTSILRVLNASCECEPYAQRSFVLFTQLVYSLDHWCGSSRTHGSCCAQWPLINNIEVDDCAIVLFIHKLIHKYPACRSCSPQNQKTALHTHIHISLHRISACSRIVTEVCRGVQRVAAIANCIKLLLLKITWRNGYERAVAEVAFYHTFHSLFIFASIRAFVSASCQRSHNQSGSQQQSAGNLRII